MDNCIRRLLLGAAAAAALYLSGCTAAPIIPSAKDMAPLREIEVVIQTPPSNFSYHYGGSTAYVQPQPNMSVGTAVGINIVANLLTMAVEHAKTTTSREAEGPVGSTVANIDLRAVVMRELRSAQGPNAPQFVESQRKFPDVDPLSWPDMLSATAKPVADLSADAILYVSIQPLFRNQFDQVVLSSGSFLVSRSGAPILASFVRFIGPDHPDLKRSELVQWWADERYRRHIQHGVRASLMPTTDYFVHPPTEKQRDDLVALVSRLQPMPNAERVRTTQCALASDDARVVYRFERTGWILHAIAHCSTEKPRLFDSEADPRHSWTTSIQPPLTAPPTK